MSTDSSIPERWHSVDKVLDLGEAMDAHFHHALTELGTTESLVRALARDLQVTRMQIIEGNVGEVVLKTVCTALSRIPKELRDAK